MRGPHSGSALGFALLVALAALTAAPAAAQDHDQGVGLALRTSLAITTSGDLLSVYAPTVYFTGVSNDRFMFEPSVALFRYHFEEDDGTTEYSNTLSAIRLGVGFLFLSQSGEAGRIFWGPRAAVTWNSRSDEGPGFSDDDSFTDISAALVTGGEYFIVPRFGLGGEIGLQYTRFGAPDDAGSVDETRSLLATVGELRVRWYFR